jgi:hypothetical protein
MKSIAIALALKKTRENSCVPTLDPEAELQYDQ